MAEPRPEAVPQRAVLADAMEHANLPSLVAVLYQLTGDRRYLADPYRPTRSRGMEDNDPGGFAPEVQAEIRAAAVDAVLAWAGGRPPAVPAPTGDALLELIELAVGEPVPPEYEAMAAEDMGFTAPKAPSRAAVGLPGGRHRRGRVGHARRDPAGRGGHRPRGAGEERRRRRHLAGERLPRRGRRHPEPPLLLLVRAARAGPPTSASATRCSPTCATWPTPTTCARSSGSAPRWRARSTATSAGPSPPPRARRSPRTP